MSKLIFFIDDDKMILNLLEYTLQSRQDYHVVTYQTGEECLENLSQEPKLIVLDHILTGSSGNLLDGMDTLKEIRKANTDIPVIILTGQRDDDLLAEFIHPILLHFVQQVSPVFKMPIKATLGYAQTSGEVRNTNILYAA